MTPEQATKRYDRIMKQLSSPSKSTTGKMMKLFAGTNKKTKPASPSNIAERFDKALKGAPFTPKQRTSMYNSANKIYKNFLKESEKGLSRAEKKIKEGTAKYPELNVKKIKEKNIIPRTRARIASLKVQDPEVGQEGPYKDTTDFFADEGKAIGDVKEEAAINPQSLDYAKFTPLITAALQEAIAKIETLETKVAALEAA